MRQAEADQNKVTDREEAMNEIERLNEIEARWLWVKIDDLNKVASIARAALKREADLGQRNNDLAVRHAALLTQNVQQEEEIENLERQICSLREALEYLASESNWDKEDEQYRLVRPGGLRQEGICLISRHLNPWLFAAEALGKEKPLNLDLPKIVDALLSERNSKGEIIWQRDQEWLAGLIVALAEERASVYQHMRREPGILICEKEALADFHLTEEKYAELKNGLETVIPEGPT